MIKYIKCTYNYYRSLVSLLFNKNSFLVQSGYLKSIKLDKPIDSDENPIPWMNYSLINFLKERLDKKMNVFEYGSGYSTLFFAKEVNSITSIEYDKKWYDKLNSQINQILNINLIHIPIGINYVDGLKHKSVKYNNFDIIIIDGRKRVACSKIAINHLTSNGVLILDDSNRKRYIEVFSLYLKNGYKEITFKDFKPQDLSLSSSTIFYKSDNILNI